MSVQSIIRYLTHALPAFARADRGNLAVIAVVAVIPVIGLIGAVVDFGRASNARWDMQAALDSTALQMSKDAAAGRLTQSQVTAKALAYFKTLCPDTEVLSAEITGTLSTNVASAPMVQLNGSVAINTDFLKLAGVPKIRFEISSRAAWSKSRMRIAMALDNTGSMADGKMPALKAASKQLIDQLRALVSQPGDVLVSIIPFAKDVNVGSDNHGQDWIDWSDWDAANGTCSKPQYTRKTSCDANGQTWIPADHATWTGCVTDRNRSHDVQNTPPTTSNVATLFPADEYVSGAEKYCKTGNSPYLQPLLPLTDNWTALKAKIDAMEPTGNTNQAIGLAWAWQSLTTSAPLHAPAEDPNFTYKKAIILVSDGLNTQNRWYSRALQIDNRQKVLCENIKAVKDPATNLPVYTIYTIQVNTGRPADETSAVLQYCASSPDDFYMLTSAEQIVATFKSIGDSLSRLRVAR